MQYENKSTFFKCNYLDVDPDLVLSLSLSFSGVGDLDLSFKDISVSWPFSPTEIQKETSWLITKMMKF